MNNGEQRATTSFSNNFTAPAPNAVKRSRVTTNNNEQRTTTSFSNDFTVTAPSISYFYSHPLAHNISCSMTRNSTDFDCSVGKDDQIWCAGEEPNGSIHSRFRPIGDGGVAFANNPLISGKPSSSSDYSFYPSKLPARPGMEVAISGDSRKKLPNLEDNDAFRSERILYDIVSESISSVALIAPSVKTEGNDQMRIEGKFCGSFMENNKV
ncbi:Protein OBERON 3 [Cardamine amara subsp. amara]|uniref:Protein OBERON 3 n=1 Tax=Cardamine amara subsp. amara TaxID=228776 RepID=A0ABD0ZAA9_CARAN